MADDFAGRRIRGDGVAARKDVLGGEQAQAAGERCELGAVQCELGCGLEALKVRHGLLDAIPPLANLSLRLAGQGDAGVIQSLGEFLEAPARVREREAMTDLGEAFFRCLQVLPRKLPQPR